MRHGFDTANPGTVSFAGFDVAGGYLGGATPHVWTAAQWDAQPARWRAPYWLLRTDVSADVQGHQAAARMTELGAPRGSLVFLDMETRKLPSEVDAFATEVHAAGFTCGVYGSSGSLFANPPRAGYMVADPTGKDHLYAHPAVIGTQYGQATLHGIVVDLDVFTDDCPLWDARPAGPPARPAWARNAITDLNGIITDLTTVRDDIAANVH